MKAWSPNDLRAALADLVRHGARVAIVAARSCMLGTSLMKTHRPVFGILAVLLAVIMPLEQAHCAWMTWDRPAASGLSHAGTAAADSHGGVDHSCCAKSRSQAQHTATPPSCLCERIPPASLTTHVDFGGRPHTASLVVLISEVEASLALSLTRAPAPALDVGSPPLPVDPGAHGLRAPPLSA
jgi:hypothetical protein